MTIIILIALSAWLSGYAAGRWHATRLAKDNAYNALVRHIELELESIEPRVPHKVVVSGPKRPLRLRRVK